MEFAVKRQQPIAFLEEGSALPSGNRHDRWRAEIQQQVAEVFAGGARGGLAEAPILVYSMGKVGSSSVMSTLLHSRFAKRAFHVHVLRAERFAPRKRHRLWLATGETKNRHHYESEAIVDQIAANPKQPFKIITLVRDPIARDISTAFQVMHRVPHVWRANGQVDVERAINHLIAGFAVANPCGPALNWFDNELKHVFGIDVLAETDDSHLVKERGWQIFRQGQVEALLIRLDDLSRVGPVALGTFLGTPEPISLVTDNVRKDETYAAVREEFRLPRSICEHVYSAPMVRRFYSETEIEKMMARWCAAEETAREGETRIRDALLDDIRARTVWTDLTAKDRAEHASLCQSGAFSPQASVRLRFHASRFRNSVRRHVLGG